MKKTLLLTIYCIGLFCFFAQAQDPKEKVMEKRAREMHRVLTLDDKEAWKKFILENYTQALIDKPMRQQIEGGPQGGQKPKEAKPGDNLEAKVMMFQQLHNDFGNSKIVSVKPAGDKIEMAVKATSGLNGTFSLRFAQVQPYLIDGLGIEVN